MPRLMTLSATRRSTGFACSDGTPILKPVDILVVEVDGNTPLCLQAIGSMTFRSRFSGASGALLDVGLTRCPNHSDLDYQRRLGRLGASA